MDVSLDFPDARKGGKEALFRPVDVPFWDVGGCFDGFSKPQWDGGVVFKAEMGRFQSIRPVSRPVFRPFWKLVIINSLTVLVVDDVSFIRPNPEIYRLTRLSLFASRAFGFNHLIMFQAPEIPLLSSIICQPVTGQDRLRDVPDTFAGYPGRPAFCRSWRMTAPGIGPRPGWKALPGHIWLPGTTTLNWSLSAACPSLHPPPMIAVSFDHLQDGIDPGVIFLLGIDQGGLFRIVALMSLS